MDKQQKIKLFSNLLIGSAIVCTLIAFLLLLNYRQLSQTDPLESTAMTALLERLKDDPDNQQLKEEIRNLDLLARKAFFNNQWQMNTGAILLLLSALVFGLSLNTLNKLQSTIDRPEAENQHNALAGKLSQRGIVISGAVILFLALGASYLTRDHLQSFVTEENRPAKQTEQIEVIEVAAAGSESLESPPVTTGVANDTSVDAAGPEPGEEEKIEEAEEADKPAPPPAAVSYPGLATVRQQHGAFRGPLGNGVSFHKDIPTTWNAAEGQHILWKVPAPKNGYNSPVIWGDKIFLAAADRNKKTVYCYNRHSGAPLWQRAIENVPGTPPVAPKVSEDTGLSAPTLCTDGVRVYAIFATGDVAGIDLSGEVVWARNLGLPANHYGHSSSLVCWQGKLFVQYDTNEGAKVMALDGSTGETVWETNRKVKASWASPILASIGGTYQLILSSDPLVAAYDVDTGKELWSVDCMMGEVGPSPAFGGGLVFAANEYARLAAIRPGSPATIVWEDNEYLPEVASPVIAGELLYVATSYGVIACYDAKTGEKYWEHESDTGFYASPVIADGKLYALDMDGVMHIFRDDKEKQLIGQPTLGETTVATPAFANGRIYIRGAENLYCIGN